MTKSSRNLSPLLLAFSVLTILAVQVFAQQYPAILAGSDLTRVVPASFYFEGQSAPTQMRNSAAVRLAVKSYVIAGLVDTSGYSSEVRGKYEGFLITDSPIVMGGSALEPGAYGFGFSTDKMNIFDVGGKQLMSVEAHKDTEMKRPRPLMMTKSADGIRLYDGRFYVTFSLK
ncbi:MAG TPA: hypothetical protein VI756_29910 [Blastocatellia bacterium]